MRFPHAVSRCVTAALCLSYAHIASADVRHNPGSPTPLPHQKYIHVVSETDSPVQQVYIKSKDGLYVAAAMRKPKGNGPFPAMIMFHGAPGGRGIEQLVGWVARRSRRPGLGTLPPGRLRRHRRRLSRRQHESDVDGVDQRHHHLDR
jgi:hypothetical protein